MKALTPFGLLTRGRLDVTGSTREMIYPVSDCRALQSKDFSGACVPEVCRKANWESYGERERWQPVSAGKQDRSAVSAGGVRKSRRNAADAD
jgi:hypothetical protein